MCNNMCNVMIRYHFFCYLASIISWQLVRYSKCRTKLCVFTSMTNLSLEYCKLNFAMSNNTYYLYLFTLITHTHYKAFLFYRKVHTFICRMQCLCQYDWLEKSSSNTWVKILLIVIQQSTPKKKHIKKSSSRIPKNKN